MKPDPDILFQYLDQTLQLYGNHLILEENNLNVFETFHGDLDSFNQSICTCQKCPLSQTRNNFVFGVGNPQADIVFVGEAPGKQEDLQGVPFVGRAGKLLDKILAANELTRDDVYICNVLKCRPPQNRDPLPFEVEQCEPYLINQLHLINPKLIVALGRISACTILKTKESLKNLRNRIFKYAGIDLLVTYHPAALLRNPNFKKPAWEDFQLIRNKYLLQQ
jgi:DNA polymerase